MIEDRRVGERRTMSLRGPGAGSLTPGSVPASNPCLNCGSNIQLVYCPECGQRELDPDPTFREFVHEAAEQLLGWDGKLVQSFRLLVTKPGLLTQEYLAGRRVRYLTPLRLYLTASVMYFFALAIVPDVTPIKVQVTRQNGATVSADAQPVPSINPVRKANEPASGVAAAMKRGKSRTQVDPALQRDAIRSALPTLTFALVPWFAYAVGAVYKRYRRRFPQHLAFALHVHAFMFLVSAPLTLIGFARSQRLNDATAPAMLVAVIIWTWIALRRVYGSTAGETAVKFVRIGLIYSLGFIIAAGIMMTYTFYRLGSS